MKTSDRLSQLLAGSGRSVEWMIHEITHICRDMKPRAPGSEGEREAAGYMAGILKNECGCAEIKTETFREHPAAFYGYFWISAALSALCAVSFFIRPWLSLAFGCAALLLFFFQFVLYRQIVDPLFPEKEGVNVTAVRPCRGEIKRRVFLNGHTDAAWEFLLNYHCGGVIFEIPGGMALLGVIYYIALSLLTLFGAGDWVRAAAFWGLAFLPFFALVACTSDPRRVVDGANDNLTGCYIGISLLREMEKRGIDLEHTELGVILTGSEEAGLRGAKAWCRAHGAEYRDVPTYIVSFDTIHDPRFLMINRKDLNGTLTSDRELCDLLREAAQSVGVEYRTGKVPLFGGGTDSAAFTQGGFRSVAVTGLNHRLEDYYHTRRDTYDNLNREGLEKCWRATAAFIARMDEMP